MFTLFYDGRCPLCMKEIRQLRQWNTAGEVRFVNIHDDDFPRDFPHIDADAALAILHGQLDDGRIVTGIDATVAAWEGVGHGHWVRWLRWPGIRWISPALYRGFARYRPQIARLLTGRSQCDNDDCRNQ